MNLQNFFIGKSFDAYTYFGAHTINDGVVFRTYAPNAKQITIIGEFNSWHEQPMSPIHKKGIWEFFTPDAHPGQMYKYVIYGKNGRKEHCDPYGFGMEFRPGSCSIIRNLTEYKFTDQKWLRKRTRCFDKPLNIYELHLGSWKNRFGHWHTYSEIAEHLISYLKEYGYNYVEFMPLSEHPCDGSWGYQNTGYFSPTSRYGTPVQLMELINKLHNAEIGVILDFVPAHFAVDSYGLKLFDGNALYESPDKSKQKSEWGSYNFNHARPEVISFLQSAANFWLKEYHFDGLRVDAVSRMIYHKGNESLGENASSIQFLKSLNSGLHKLHSKAILIAEDSTAYPRVTWNVEDGGLGFDYKWDLGWTYDTFRYLERSPADRASIPEKISFSFYYGYNERYILPFSHDEVAYKQKTIINKLYGNYEEKFAQARLLYMYMMTHPGKKLNFMGNELAQFQAWKVNYEQDWNLLANPIHDTFHHYMQELNLMYLKKKSLWEYDHIHEGCKWIDCGSDNKCVFGYLRNGKKYSVCVILNFSDCEASIALPTDISGKINILLNTDWQCFGGNIKRITRKNIPPKLSAYSGILFEIKQN